MGFVLCLVEEACIGIYEGAEGLEVMSNEIIDERYDFVEKEANYHCQYQGGIVSLFVKDEGARDRGCGGCGWSCRFSKKGSIG